MLCIYCKKEFEPIRTDQKFCSTKCRVYFTRNNPVTDNPVTDKSVTSNVTSNVTDNVITSVTDNSTTQEVWAGDNPDEWQEGQFRISKVDGLKVKVGYCKVCGRRIADIKEQWIGETRKDANLIEKCISCIK